MKTSCVYFYWTTLEIVFNVSILLSTDFFRFVLILIIFVKSIFIIHTRRPERNELLKKYYFKQFPIIENLKQQFHQFQKEILLTENTFYHSWMRFVKLFHWLRPKIKHLMNNEYVFFLFQNYTSLLHGTEKSMVN